MKNTLYVLTLAVACGLLISSCQKNDSPTPPQQRRLTAYSHINVGSDTINYTIHYNAENKIVSITNRYSSGYTSTVFNVQYNGNEIYLTDDFPSGGGGTVFDTIHLFVGGDNKPTMRVRHFIEKDTGSRGLMQYGIDTIRYQYDAGGLLLSQADRYFDSAWDRSRLTTTFKIRYIKNTNYTNSNGRLLSYKQVTYDTTNNYDFNVGVLLPARMYSDETNANCDYTNAYQNASDFSNQLILNEVHALTQLTTDKLYTHLPGKISYSVVSKDANGVVTNTSNYEEDNNYSYDSTGIMIGRGFITTQQTTSPQAVRWNFYY